MNMGEVTYLAVITRALEILETKTMRKAKRLRQTKTFLKWSVNAIKKLKIKKRAHLMKLHGRMNLKRVSNNSARTLIQKHYSQKFLKRLFTTKLVTRWSKERKMMRKRHKMRRRRTISNQSLKSLDSQEKSLMKRLLSWLRMRLSETLRKDSLQEPRSFKEDLRKSKEV